ncbi:MAG: hypothetical protein H6726_26320 [Sandaracinaceae bacterium]|nr:hypothetical protein [Sandaracinaceae bacterium]
MMDDSDSLACWTWRSHLASQVRPLLSVMYLDAVLDLDPSTSTHASCWDA